MPKVTRYGQIIATFPTRADCFVFVFSQGFVYDQHSRRRNTLLPGVKIEGVDYEEEKDAAN